MTQVEEKRALPSSPSLLFLLLPGEGMHCPENERREREGEKEIFFVLLPLLRRKKGEDRGEGKEAIFPGKCMGKREGGGGKTQAVRPGQVTLALPLPPSFYGGL